MSLNESRADELLVIGMKNIYSFKSLSDAAELYFVYFRKKFNSVAFSDGNPQPHPRKC